jgi:hypothetical protein
MSADEQRRIKADVLLDYQESEERLAAIKEKAHRLAMVLEGVAGVLKKQPDSISIESLPPIFNRQPIEEVVTDYKTALAEVRRLAERAQELGLKV